VSPCIQPDAKPPLMDEEIAALICRDICEGLNQIHKKNFIHRDLKPDNILIHENLLPDGSAPEDPSERYVAKITDFGLSAEVHANVFNGSSNINEVMGTILFMAPEQATGKRYGKRIDMWALGIIMFQILTGKHPFYVKGDTEETYIKRISKSNLEKTLDSHFEKYAISEHAQSLLYRLLARGLSDRYRCAQAVQHPWITRNFKEKAPLTQNEQNTQMEGEIKLRSIQSMMLFLAIQKHGRIGRSPSKRQTFNIIN
jgi:serine/threonine protein kinase